MSAYPAFSRIIDRHYNRQKLSTLDLTEREIAELCATFAEDHPSELNERRCEIDDSELVIVEAFAAAMRQFVEANPTEDNTAAIHAEFNRVVGKFLFSALIEKIRDEADLLFDCRQTLTRGEDVRRMIRIERERKHEKAAS